MTIRRHSHRVDILAAAATFFTGLIVFVLAGSIMALIGIGTTVTTIIATIIAAPIGILAYLTAHETAVILRMRRISPELQRTLVDLHISPSVAEDIFNQFIEADEKRQSMILEFFQEQLEEQRKANQAREREIRRVVHIQRNAEVQIYVEPHQPVPGRLANVVRYPLDQHTGVEQHA